MSKDSVETRFPASEDTPGQGESRTAYQRFVEGRPEDLAWWADYLELRAAGWDWRKAVYIAWASSPLRERWPGTQSELATDVLGLRSDRTIRKWKEKFPEIEDVIAVYQAGPLMAHRRDAFEALVAVATTPEPGAHSDRKLFFEMTGDYRPRGTVAVTGGEEGEPLSIQVIGGLGEDDV